MRYSQIDLQIYDIMWFAVDRNGCIGCFTAGGSANIPEFICRSKEDNEYVCDYFLNELPESTVGRIYGIKKNTQLWKECSSLVKKGIICFDDKDNGVSYQLVAMPRDSIAKSSISSDIQKIMADFNLDTDFCIDKLIEPQNAY